MASNAKFEVEIYGNVTKFENSLKGVNTAMSGLRGEAKNLREALKLDPANPKKWNNCRRIYKRSWAYHVTKQQN